MPLDQPVWISFKNKNVICVFKVYSVELLGLHFYAMDIFTII